MLLFFTEFSNSANVTNSFGIANTFYQKNFQFSIMHYAL